MSCGSRVGRSTAGERAWPLGITGVLCVGHGGTGGMCSGCCSQPEPGTDGWILSVPLLLPLGCGVLGLAVSSGSCRNPRPLHWDLSSRAGIPQSRGSLCPSPAARAARAGSSLLLPAALLCPQRGSPGTSRAGAALCAAGGCGAERGEGLTPSSFPRKALASGVSLPLAAADMAGPCHECSPSSSAAPAQAPVQTLPHPIPRCACPGAGWDPACSQWAAGGCAAAPAPCAGSCHCSLCWLQPWGRSNPGTEFPLRRGWAGGFCSTRCSPGI